jgi:hypothetical protein
MLRFRKIFLSPQNAKEAKVKKKCKTQNFLCKHKNLLTQKSGISKTHTHPNFGLTEKRMITYQNSGSTKSHTTHILKFQTHNYSSFGTTQNSNPKTYPKLKSPQFPTQQKTRNFPTKLITHTDLFPSNKTHKCRTHKIPVNIEPLWTNANTQTSTTHRNTYASPCLARPSKVCFPNFTMSFKLVINSDTGPDIPSIVLVSWSSSADGSVANSSGLQSPHEIPQSARFASLV